MLQKRPRYEARKSCTASSVQQQAYRTFSAVSIQTNGHSRSPFSAHKGPPSSGASLRSSSSQLPADPIFWKGGFHLADLHPCSPRVRFRNPNTCAPPTQAGIPERRQRVHGCRQTGSALRAQRSRRHRSASRKEFVERPWGGRDKRPEGCFPSAPVDRAPILRERAGSKDCYAAPTANRFAAVCPRGPSWLNVRATVEAGLRPASPCPG